MGFRDIAHWPDLPSKPGPHIVKQSADSKKEACALDCYLHLGAALSSSTCLCCCPALLVTETLSSSEGVRTMLAIACWQSWTCQTSIYFLYDETSAAAQDFEEAAKRMWEHQSPSASRPLVW